MSLSISPEYMFSYMRTLVKRAGVPLDRATPPICHIARAHPPLGPKCDQGSCHLAVRVLSEKPSRYRPDQTICSGEDCQRKHARLSPAETGAHAWQQCFMSIWLVRRYGKATPLRSLKLPKPTTPLSAGVTAFLDILGFADRVLAAQTTKDVEQIVADMRRIQEFFDFRSKDKYVKESHLGSKKTVLAFSDSVVVNVPLKSTMTKLQGTFDTLMGELAGMALAQGRCATSGLFLRGGVDIGWWYRKATILASESLVWAYRTEKTANVPVIALTDKLYEFFSKHRDRSYYSEEIEPVRTMLRKYTGEGCQGPVSFWYLDYISVTAESVNWSPTLVERSAFLAMTRDERNRIRENKDKAAVREWFRDHARAIKRAHAAARNDHVRAKYIWLADYHNEIATTFTTSPLALCKLTKR